MRASLCALMILPTIAIAADSSAPTHMIAAIESFVGPSYRVELVDKDHVLYSVNERTFTSAESTVRTQIEVSSQRWAQFREHLETLHVWSWNASYSDPRVRDGASWIFDVAFSDRRMNSQGNNAYPDTKQFDAWRKSIGELVDGRPFH